MFFQMLLTFVLQKQLGPGCNDTPSCHLGLCLWPSKGSAKQMCYPFAIRAGMEEIFSADSAGAQGSALAHVCHALTHFVW